MEDEGTAEHGEGGGWAREGVEVRGRRVCWGEEISDAGCRYWLRDWIVASALSLTLAPWRRIQTWALEEARRRLEAEGILPDPEVGRK